MLEERKVRKAIEIYPKGADPRAPFASPYFGNLRGLPQMLIQISSHELLLSDSMRFAQKAKEAGVEVTLEV